MTNFPILVRWTDTQRYEVIRSPMDIESGRSFTVIETNVQIVWGGTMTPVEVMRYMNQAISAAEKLTDSVKVIELLTRLRDAEVVRLVALEAEQVKSKFKDYPTCDDH